MSASLHENVCARSDQLSVMPVAATPLPMKPSVEAGLKWGVPPPFSLSLLHLAWCFAIVLIVSVQVCDAHGLCALCIISVYGMALRLYRVSNVMGY